MDVNHDGFLDILSGSYSRHEPNMAGLFQVLHGKEDRSFGRAKALSGSDDELLIIETGGADVDVTDKICTRPFAVDFDGDGKLDIVSGNFTGTFALFRGVDGGNFASRHEWLETDGERLRVDAHSDPFLCDWDGDGDLDLLSGSSSGGVFLFANEGTRKAPKYGARQTLLEPAGHHSEFWGDAELHGPQSSTRVWADDLDGDGKLDLLVGDNVALCHPVGDLVEAEAKAKLAEWSERQSKVFESITPSDGKEPTEADQARFQKAYEKLQEERAAIVRDERTGFVWFLRRS